VPIQPFDVTWFDRNLPESFVHIGFTPRGTAVGASEEVLHRLCEI
jgi:hypothetical protein